jgi:DNA primase
MAAAYFRDRLAGPEGSQARHQLTTRHVSDQTIEQLGIGFAPPARDGLKRQLLARGCSLPILVQSGLIVDRAGDTLDRFRNRIMLPICRESGAIVAFGGRALGAEQVPKYLNSPETPIYSKGRTLYGLHLMKAAIRQHGFAVLVEGYFDFAQVFQTGAAPVVASCGTALTASQAHLLRRFTTKVVLSYDPDPAGEAAAARSSDLLVAEGFDVNVAALEPGEDPDTFIRRRGAAQYRERLRGSRPYLEYLLDRAATSVDLGRDEGRRDFLARMLDVAARIPDAAARDQFADRLAHRARITEAVVRAEIRKAAAGRRRTVAGLELPPVGDLKAAERGLIWGIFHQTTRAVEAMTELEPEDFTGLAGREVFLVARSLQHEPADHLPAELLRRLSTMDAQLVTAVAGQQTPPIDAATGLLDCVRTLKRLRCERERADLQREIDRLQGSGSARHDDRIDVLLNQKRLLAQRIEELT